MTEIAEMITYYSRFILPALALVITLSCGFALITAKAKRYQMAEIINAVNGDRTSLDRWEISVGRSKLCDIKIGYGSVSRFHAVISRRCDGWYITDTYSKTGTKVNNTPITKTTQLFDGDSITFGSAVMFFSAPLYPSPNPRVFKAVKTESKKADENYDIPFVKEPAPNFKVSESPALYVERTATAYPLSGTVTIGRDENSDIILPFMTVSRKHARITAENEGFALEDIGSASGTKINGKEITRKQLLFNGDEIDIGGEKLTYYDNYSAYSPF